MKKILQYFLFILQFVFIFSSNSYCQEYIFKIVAATKNVQIKTNGSGDWSQLKTGDKLFTDDIIQLKNNEYVGLAHVSGATLELRNAGIFKVNDLKMYLAGKNSSVLKKFSDFLISEIITTRNEKKSDDHGAVFRERANYLEVDFPKSTFVFDSLTTFKWYKHENQNFYVFKLMNPAGITVYMQKVTDTTLAVNFKNLNLDKDTCYFWSIYLQDEEPISSDTSCIKIMNRQKSKVYLSEMKSLKDDTAFTKNSLQNILLAKYCEEKELNYEAFRYYENALQSAGNVQEYKDLFTQFLFRQNLLKRIDQLKN
ncbi:MAG: hypothetical protein NTX22_01865 [Ignavibacteriales bacterium]|nr:hypothetical protein [Ignavibacteriales bacterium]